MQSPTRATRADQSPTFLQSPPVNDRLARLNRYGTCRSDQTGSREANQTSARIIRTSSHRRLPLQASVSTSPNPIMAGGHTPAMAPLTATTFAASADAGVRSDFRVCSNIAGIVPCRAGNDRLGSRLRRTIAHAATRHKQGRSLGSSQWSIASAAGLSAVCATTAMDLRPAGYPPSRIGRSKRHTKVTIRGSPALAAAHSDTNFGIQRSSTTP
jgi:hypothetical protein